jgi:hypothetical protein
MRPAFEAHIFFAIGADDMITAAFFLNCYSTVTAGFGNPVDDAF